MREEQDILNDFLVFKHTVRRWINNRYYCTHTLKEVSFECSIVINYFSQNSFKVVLNDGRSMTHRYFVISPDRPNTSLSGYFRSVFREELKRKFGSTLRYLGKRSLREMRKVELLELKLSEIKERLRK